MQTIYNAVIQPYLFYCSEVRDRSFHKYITPITIIPKKAVRLICKCHCHAQAYITIILKFKIIKYITQK